MGEAESKAPQAERNHDAKKANNVSRRPKANRCHATRSMGKGQSKEDSQRLVRFPEQVQDLSRSLVRAGQGRELVCPAVWNELGHVAILMDGLPAFVEFAA